jgi:hypothetical protein
MGKSPSQEAKSLSYSRNSPPFRELEGSLFCSQEPGTETYVKPDESSPYFPAPFNIHFHIKTENYTQDHMK